MKVKVLGSNSNGNCYILQASNSTLILELGVNFKDIKNGIDYDYSKVAGALITHEHGDHAKCVKEVINNAINVYASSGTIEAIGIKSNRLKSIEVGIPFYIGPFRVLAFNVNHDAAQPLGFMIHHDECGNLLFITDTTYLPDYFINVNHVFIEANYCEQILESRKASVHPSLYARVKRSHLSIQDCQRMIKNIEMDDVRTITLIHLSDGNSDEIEFVKKVKKQTGKQVIAAKKGIEIDISKSPF